MCHRTGGPFIGGGCNRTGWGFALHQIGSKMENSYSHKLCTSSTCMEVEAVHPALKCLSLHHINHSCISYNSYWLTKPSFPHQIWLGRIGWSFVMGWTTLIYVTGSSINKGRWPHSCCFNGTCHTSAVLFRDWSAWHPLRTNHYYLNPVIYRRSSLNMLNFKRMSTMGPLDHPQSIS